MARHARSSHEAETEAEGPMRLDKWLWAARFYKTRAIAAEQVDRGRVQVNGHGAKVGRAVRPGDVIALVQGHDRREVVVEALSLARGPAAQAQQLYRETPASIAAREVAAAARRLAPEPALAIAAQRQGRPTKRDRRALAQVRDGLGRSPHGRGWPGGGEERHDQREDPREEHPDDDRLREPAWDDRWSARLGPDRR